MNWIVLFYVIYLGIPLALLLFFGLYRPKLAPLTLLICPLVIFLMLYDFLQIHSIIIIFIFKAYFP